MNLDEAFALLGVSEETPPDAARRAYLKLTRKHKPESDPQGFMRLREAYETARSFLELRAQYPALRLQRHSEPQSSTDLSSAESSPADLASTLALSPATPSTAAPSTLLELTRPAEGGQTESEAGPSVLGTRSEPTATSLPVAGDEAADTSGFPEFQDFDEDEPGRSDQRLADYHRQADALPEDDHTGRAAVWEAAIVEVPDAEEAHWCLFEELSSASQRARAGAVVLLAYQKGLPGFAGALLRGHPERAPEELWSQTSADMELRWAAIFGLITRAHDVRRLVPLLERAIRDACEDDEAWFDGELVLRGISLLLGRGEKRAADARRLTEPFADWIRHANADHRRLPLDVAARWVLVEELSAASRELPDSVLAVIGVGLAKDDRNTIAISLEQISQSSPTEAGIAASVLSETAPNLRAAFGSFIHAEQESEVPTKRWGFGYGWVVGLVLMALHGASRCERSRTADTAPTIEARQMVEQARERRQWEANDGLNEETSYVVPPLASGGTPRISVVQSNVRKIAMAAALHGDVELEGLANAVGEAFEPLDCRHLAPSFERLREATTGKDLTTEVQYLWGEVLVACPQRTNP